jgi:glycosyltransferase involved in cell wall biosynthesis
MQPISVIITTFNEAHNIEGVLHTVKWADEVMVVDSFSTDRTVDLATQHGRSGITTRIRGSCCSEKLGNSSS